MRSHGWSRVGPVFSLLVGACGANLADDAPAKSAGAPAAVAAVAAAGAGTAGLAACTLAAIADRHLAAIGPAFARPQTVRAVLHRGSGESQETLSWDARRSVGRADAAGLTMSRGVDDTGPWSVDEAGVFFRLRPDEVYGRDTMFWVFRRGHLDMMRAGKGVIDCSTEDAGARAVARVQFDGEELGRPALTFDRKSGALITMDLVDPSGRASIVTFDAWTTPDANGSRHLATSTTTSGIDESLTTFAAAEETGPCASASASDGQMCIGAPKTTFRLDLPAGGAHLVARMATHEILVRSTIGGSEGWAFVDTGAGISALDTTSSVRTPFVQGTTIQMLGANEAFAGGLGLLPTVNFGSVVAHSLPVAAVPIPMLATFGSLRPQIILGFSIYESAALRVDYGHPGVTLTRLDDVHHSADAIAVPLRVLNGRFVATIDVEGHPASVMVDTGSSGAVSLDDRWADGTHAFDDGRPNVTFVANEGAGTHETSHRIVRAKIIKLGDLPILGSLVDIGTSPVPSDVAGIVGNGVFSMCRAAIFDTAARTLWLEPPCARTPVRYRFGWVLLPRSSDETAAPSTGAAQANATRRASAARPWVVTKLIPNASAEKAGVLVGDEIVQVGSVRLGADPTVIDAIAAKPVGSHVNVLVRRSGTLRTVDVTLIDPLPS